MNVLLGAGLLYVAGVFDSTTEVHENNHFLKRDVDEVDPLAYSGLKPSFTVVVLGSEGGPVESDISGYLFKPYAGSSSDGWMAVEAGTLMHGIQKGYERGAFRRIANAPVCTYADQDCIVAAGTLMRDHIKGYMFSHGHLDHMSGFVIGTAGDKGGKTIYGINDTTSSIINNVFNNYAWPNMGDQGSYAIKQYTYQTIDNSKYYPLPNNMSTTAFPVTHGTVGPAPLNSTAFFIRNDANGDEAIYFGDVGPDSIGPLPRIIDVWKHAAPLVRSKKLRAIFIESSYTSSRPGNLLFGHLTPVYIREELLVLAGLVGGRNPLRGLNVVITHTKPDITNTTNNVRLTIERELKATNDLGVNYILPVIGQRIDF
ncbi:cyclic-AMP phosphodiesterase [Basidiobolus meristosporus CBS 931.73]|uniref:Cyclic-AMP phosphodiesterase n=1 Tax=Basidiobolus meristosporus CBS 931.73 TaxID=1314790 RepID=A0A1Y1XU81_9FUNG|nr:cyclic-AMP phosphodiesterase [Basidiobolus meristosporus CBS 931.73]|eukprot:ORX89298.1 cyclic-AMP phosphodiesterase [Basidiobolus meristosporus CBS 931.73]